MIYLIPVSRFQVVYESAVGRPFSQLEQMVLRAIGEGVTDLDVMQATFCVHPRILIEALVTLTQAGWVSLSSQEGGFLLTSEGVRATRDGEQPTTTAVSRNAAFVLLERVSGGVIANNDVRFFSRKQLETVWEVAGRLKASYHENNIDEGRVRQLLPRRQGEWVRWIGPITMKSKNAHWIPVDVDTVNNTVVGLPDQWGIGLTPWILEEVRTRSDEVTADPRSGEWVGTGDSWRPATSDDLSAWEERAQVELQQSDLVIGSEDHGALLKTALAEAATNVFVAAAFLNAPALRALGPHLMAALARGVSVDLLWGYSAGADQGQAALGEVEKIAYEAKRSGYSGVLRFNRAASGSHAKLLLFDGATGMEACLGSFNWLSALEGAAHGALYDISVRLREPFLVAELCGCAAGMWVESESERDRLSSTPGRWRTVAGELERRAAHAATCAHTPGAAVKNTTARLVFDREHEGILREWAATARERLFVLSHRLGRAAESRLVRAGECRPSQLRVVYGHTELQEEWRSKVERMVQHAGGTIVRREEVHAKVLVRDSSVCISSYNFLAADPFGTARRARELGVELNGGQIATWVSQALSRRFGPNG